jgi:hypothetical protein
MLLIMDKNGYTTDPELLNRLKEISMSIIDNTIDVKPYSLTELARIYGVTNRTMKNWIVKHDESIGEKVGRLYTTLQVKIIFEKLGLPGKIEE